MCLKVGDVWAGCHFRSVSKGGYFKVAEDCGGGGFKEFQASHGEFPDFHIGVFGGAHADEMPPGAEVTGDHDAGLSGARQDSLGCLVCLFASEYRVRFVT